MTSATPLEYVSAKTTLLEILVTSVQLVITTSPLVKLVNVTFKDPWTTLAMPKEYVLAIMDTLVINVMNAFLIITCITMFAKVRLFLKSLFQRSLTLDCSECECNVDGSVDDTCDADGKCTCKEHIAGDKCDEAEPGYYEFPDPTRKIFYILSLKTLSFLWIFSKIRSCQVQFHHTCLQQCILCKYTCHQHRRYHQVILTTFTF